MEQNYTRWYQRDEFTALDPSAAVSPALLRALIDAAGLAQPVAEVRLSNDGAAVEWSELPSAADGALVDGVVASFSQVPIPGLSAPLVSVSNSATTADSGAFVEKVSLATEPLAAGTYQLIWSCQYRMQSVVAGDAARAKLTITPAPSAPIEQLDHWGEAVVKAYNGAATFQRLEGQSITASLSIAEVGPGAGVAEMTMARISIDKIG